MRPASLLTALFFVTVSMSALAEGHGPVFGLATPTLGQDQMSSDTSFMARDSTQRTSAMFGQMFAYGLTEDWELDLGVASPMINRQEPMVRTRPGSMMDPLGGEIEFQTRYRFHKAYPGGGQRYESTLSLGGTIPYRDGRGDLDLSGSVNAAITTGYASRKWYWWAGAGYQRYFQSDGDRLGDLPYLTAVVGYRPPAWAADYPAPDWRVFVEAVAEFPQRNRLNGQTVKNSGGERVLVGPSALGLFGQWGVSGGVLFPVHHEFNGHQPRENVRARLVLTYWF